MKKITISQLRKFALLALVLVLVVSCFSACGKGGNGGETQSSQPNDSTPETTLPEDDTPGMPDDPGDPSNPTEPAVWGTVTHDRLNFRDEPGLDTTAIGRLAINTRVQILETKVVDAITWGRIDKGWVNMDYIALDGEEPDNPSEPDNTNTPEDPTDPKTDTPSTGSGKMGTVTSGLKIREGAGTSYKQVGEYAKGTRVEILETKGSWGKTDKGWISLNYVKLDGADNDKNDNNDGKTDKPAASSGKTGTVIADELNIRKGAGTSFDQVGKYKAGDRVEILEKDGTWGKTDKGWISLNYVNMDGTTGKQTGTVIITIEGGLNVRQGPGTANDRVDSYGYGKSVAIYDQVKIGGATWACTAKGWINISNKYVYIQGEKGEGAGSGTITGDELNVRTGPSTDFKSVKKLNSGDKVEILFQIKLGDTTWGYTKDGWVSMKYVEMAKAADKAE